MNRKMELTINPAEKVEGQVRVPGDQSIAHRAILFSSLTEGVAEIEGFSATEETLTTLACLKELGAEFEDDGENLKVKGKGLRGFKEPDNVLDAGNSGDTACLLMGLLAGQPFYSTLTGADSLRRHPLQGLTSSLRQMGADVRGRQNSELLPLSVRGYDLLPINYALSESNALLKSALLVAALYSRGVSEIIDPFGTRDHTERALRHLGAGIKRIGKDHIRLHSPAELKGERFRLPGDLSAAAYFIVAAALAPCGELYLEEVGVNPFRTGILDVLGQMGAEISILNVREYNCEPVADLLVKSGRRLKGVEITGEMLPRIVEEIPVLIVAALLAKGDTVINGISELRGEELDRLRSISLELQKMGACIKELPESLAIKGGAKLSGARCASHGDHRAVMTLATAALFAESESVINGVEAVQAFFPGFFENVSELVS